MKTGLPGDSWGDVIFALVVVSISNEILAHIFHLAASKGRTIVKPPIQDPGFPSQQLYQLPHLTESNTLFKDQRKKTLCSILVLWSALSPSSKCWYFGWNYFTRVAHSCPRMTDFNNSPEVTSRWPPTPPHKRKHLLSGRRNFLASQTFLSVFHDNRGEKIRWQLQQ